MNDRLEALHAGVLLGGLTNQIYGFIGLLLIANHPDWLSSGIAIQACNRTSFVLVAGAPVPMSQLFDVDGLVGRLRDAGVNVLLRTAPKHAWRPMLPHAPLNCYLKYRVPRAAATCDVGALQCCKAQT